MMSANVESMLIDHLSLQRGVDRNEVLSELEETAAIDSLEGLELAIAAERAFDITFSDEELSPALLRSVSGLVELIRSKLHPVAGIKQEASR